LKYHSRSGPQHKRISRPLRSFLLF
jgi:hypothetical protein